MTGRKFFAELKRRNVYKVAVGYAVASWPAIQVASTLVPALHLPAVITTVVVVLVALGFPLALVLAWAPQQASEAGAPADGVTPNESISQRTGYRLLVGAALVVIVVGALLAFKLLRPPSSGSVDRSRSAASAAGPEQPLREKSIAVLPFENLSDAKENAYFTNGVQDEILTTLAKVADLKVISRTSVMQFRDHATRNLPEIAESLKVAHVLEGSVQRSANRVRVTAQLIDARTDTHLWAERYDRELADVFAIQTEIAQKIAAQLQAVLSPREQVAMREIPTSDLAAYDFYLRGKEVDRANTDYGRAGFAEALALFEQAVAQDPQFVPALCMAARTHLALYWFNFDHTESRLAAAHKGIETAAALQPDAAEVNIAQAFLHYWGYRDYPAAIAALDKARRVLPNDAEVLYILAGVVRRQGRWEEAIRYLEAGLALDPRNGVIIRTLQEAYASLRRYDDAARILDRALASRPNEFGFAWWRAMIDVNRAADLRRMRDVLSSPAVHTSSPERLANARLQYAFLARDYAQAREALSAFDAPTFTSSGSYVTPREWPEGGVALGLGDRMKAEASFASAREVAARLAAASPDDAKALIILARIDAALGRRELAIKEAEQARALLPVEKDAFDGADLEVGVAEVYTRVGEVERALDILERGATRPRGITYGNLSLSEVWDKLRGHPRFENLLKSLAPKDAPSPSK